ACHPSDRCKVTDVAGTEPASRTIGPNKADARSAGSPNQGVCPANAAIRPSRPTGCTTVGASCGGWSSTTRPTATGWSSGASVHPTLSETSNDTDDPVGPGRPGATRTHGGPGQTAGPS